MNQHKKLTRSRHTKGSQIDSSFSILKGRGAWPFLNGKRFVFLLQSVMQVSLPCFTTPESETSIKLHVVSGRGASWTSLCTTCFCVILVSYGSDTMYPIRRRTFVTHGLIHCGFVCRLPHSTPLCALLVFAPSSTLKKRKGVCHTLEIECTHQACGRQSPRGTCASRQFSRQSRRGYCAASLAK